MGLKFKGIPETITLQLKEKYGLTCFVETGTHIGRSALWASNYFDVVYTIELDKEYYDKAKALFASRCWKDNIIQYLGDSVEVLPEIIGKTGNSFFFLDAHWSNDLPYHRPKLINPILNEIELILSSVFVHVIIIDDFRLFRVTPGWPSIEEIEAITDKYGYDLDLFEEEDIMVIQKDWTEWKK